MRYHVNMKKPVKPLKSLDQPLSLLGGITATHFLDEYWQKKPLLIRAALPGFDGFLSPEELAGMACEEDVQSRLVTQFKQDWQLQQGPFEEEDFLKLPDKGWTLLVQAVNQHLQDGADLLQQFDFIPHARLDDLMISYAPDGGGVGPHFDSYDVFLLQGQGQRLWRISGQTDLALVEDAPLRILANFHADEEWVLNPGDMLYLPPHLPHWGIAIGDCMTYSIGFRAPSQQELASEFLAFLQEKPQPHRLYADPDLALQAHPAELHAHMIDKVANMLEQVRWQRSDVAEFLGRYLSEPGADVVFAVPRAISLATFRKRVNSSGIALDLKSRMLFNDRHMFINGDIVIQEPSSAAILMDLADKRTLPGSVAGDIDEPLWRLLHEWYSAGYLRFPGY